MNVQYLRHLMHGQPTVVKNQAADNQTLAPGDLVCIVSGKVTKASSSVHTLLFGICLDTITTTTATATDQVNVLLLDEFSAIRMACTGSDAAAANLFTTSYDVNDSQQVNFADTTGGFLFPIALPDVVKDGFVDVTIKQSALWNA